MKHLLVFSLLLVSFQLFGQESYRPGLFFREDFKETPAQIPLSQKHISNPSLLVNLYGLGQDSLKKSHHDTPVDDPYYVWSGLCLENWMVSLKHKSNNVDLSGFAKIKIRSKQSGLRQLRICIKTSEGNWYVSDQAVGMSKDWTESEFNIQDIKWHHLDAERITETGLAKQIDLSQIEEIGFTDLMPGGRSNACSRLDWIEVYGKAAGRK